MKKTVICLSLILALLISAVCSAGSISLKSNSGKQNTVKALSAKSRSALKSASSANWTYFTLWNHCTVSELAQQGYSGILLSFMDVNGVNCNVAFQDYAWSYDAAAFKKDCDDARNKYGLKHVLVSVGGQNNTFKPNNDVNTVAKNMVDYVTSIGGDGVDFDLEVATLPINLKNLITAMKNYNPNFIVTCAPQMNYLNGKPILVSDGYAQIYDDAIKAGLFDAINLQCYNTGGYTINDRSGVGRSQYDPEFIQAAFDYLKANTPKNTLLTMGLPANAKCAGDASIFHNSRFKSEKESLSAAKAAYATFKDDARCGGIFSWSGNQDKQANYLFARTMFGGLNKVRNSAKISLH